MVPPTRPNSNPMRVDASFMMDFENSLLDDWDAHQGIPQGKCRWEDEAWATLVQANVYPHHSDIDWCEYKSFVMSGGGDEWFLESP